MSPIRGHSADGAGGPVGAGGALRLTLPLLLGALGACDPGVETRKGELVEVTGAPATDSGGEGAAPEVEAPPLQPLDAPRLLRRISLDLRGTLPAAAELDAVAADPAALDPLVEAYLADPGLRERMVDLLAEQWWTRVDEFDVRYEDYDLRATEEFPFERSVGEEPLRLAAHVIAEDLPWSEVVTADYTVANEVLGALWPLDYPEGETGWRVARYTDDRPAAGALATNGLWWRYTTTPSNMNRGRASALSRIFLCVDYIARPINFSAASTDLADPEEANHRDQEVKTPPTASTATARSTRSRPAFSASGGARSTPASRRTATTPSVRCSLKRPWASHPHGSATPSAASPSWGPRWPATRASPPARWRP